MACATCLGELGAIDPARLPVTNSGRIFEAPVLPERAEKKNLLPPWAGDTVALSVELLRAYLVPALRAASGNAQDRIAYCIQELLPVLRAAVEESKPGRANNNFRAVLEDSGVAAAVEPYLESKFEIKEPSAPKSPPPTTRPV